MIRTLHSALFSFVFFCSSLVAQDCTDGRYVEPVFPAFQRTNALPFGSNVSTGGSQQTLYMDVYEPAGDTLSMRPVVLVAFGGSFIAGTRNDVALICEELAKRGFVAIAPDYRIGLFLPNPTSTMLAVMRGTHDMKACVRYLRRSVALDDNPWRIDPDRIIVGGVSAGAISAIHATYLNDESEMPPALASLSDEIGGVEGLSGNPEYSSEVLACFSLSGAIGDTTWIAAGDPPIASVHEVGDQVVPYFTEEVYVFNLPTGLDASGSHDLHLRMENLGNDHCLLSYPGNTHVGYLATDAVTSMGFILDFCANVVCGSDAYCGAQTVGLAEHSGPALPGIYPNPASEWITLDLVRNGSVHIFDMNGSLVLAQRLDAGTAMLSVAHLPAGVYVVRTEQDGGTAQRLVITR